MTPREYQDKAKRTECDYEAATNRVALQDRMTGVKALHAVNGICGELGEFASELQRWLYYGKPLDRANLFEELGDMMWYVVLLCNTMGFDLERVMIANINKLAARYPDKFTEVLAAEESRDRAKERTTLEALVDAPPEVQQIARERIEKQRHAQEVKTEAIREQDKE